MFASATERHGNAADVEYASLRVQEGPEDAPLVADDARAERASERTRRAASAAPAKILFLDGVRGLAAFFVVTQHSRAYMDDLSLGDCSVDIFFVLSSFLLTMLFMKKSIKLVAQGASYRKWAFTLADYFSKRFFRVYPLFALVVTVLWMLPKEDQRRYYLLAEDETFELFEVLTFSPDYRFFVLWTLPLEIAYYFFIPLFVLVVLKLRYYWWLLCLLAYVWAIYEGLYTFRWNHMPLKTHFSTFLMGSLAAVVFVKLEARIKTSGFEFRRPHKIIIRVFEYVNVALLLSVGFRGLLFHWVHESIAPPTPGNQFISVFLTNIFLVETLLPSSISAMFEWNVLRYWGKISFSVYLLHGFVLFSDVVRSQTNYYDQTFTRFGLILLLATASYHLVEFPSLLMAQRISWMLANFERTGSCGVPTYSLVKSELGLEKDSAETFPPSKQ